MTNALALPKRIDWDTEMRELAKKTVAEGATEAEFQLFIEVCKNTGLDPFARQIYAVRRKQWNSRAKAYMEAQIIQVSIDGFRLIADRTDKYAGQVGPWWCGKDGEWKEVWLSDDLPAAAKVGVLRRDFQQPLYAIALFKSYIQVNDKGDAIGRWKTDPAGMLAKCAESLALRRAFPQELSGLYTSEEMAQADNPADVIQGQFTPAPEQPKNGNGKAHQPPEPPEEPSPFDEPPAQVDPVATKQEQVIAHMTAKTNLARQHVINTLNKCKLPQTAEMADFETWWDLYRGERSMKKTSDEAAAFANDTMLQPAA